MTPETEMEMVLRHIRTGEANVAKQRRRVTARQLAGEDTEVSADLLRIFEATLALHRQHLHRIRG
jgi:hypothetical protein